MNVPKIAYKQSVSKNVIKPIPKIKPESGDQKMNPYVITPKNNISERVKQDFTDFINNTYQPTHFLTIRLPQHWETTNLDHAINRLRLIMKVFEKHLLGTH